MKQKIFDLMPPATLMALVLFWANAPKAWLGHPWLLPVVIFGVMALVQLLEFFNERHEGWRLNKTEFFTDIFYAVVISTAISWATRTFAEEPMMTLKSSLGIATPWITTLPFLVQVLMVMTIWEIGQYWMHRLMHNNALLWSTHAPHHHITQLNAMKGYVGNPIELFLIGLGVVVLFDWDLAAMFAGFSCLLAISIYAHANLRADPPIGYSYIFTTIRHHSLHHTAISYEDTRCNYANAMIIMDRIFGTYREGESEIVGQGDRRRLSIKQQWLFPLQPWLDRMKQERSPPPSINGSGPL
jgi:sterol desaturase/sphingolipid hydroxylase (fatty acid hydroxylase superfamily)